MKNQNRIARLALAGVAGVGLMAAMPVQAIPNLEVTFEAEPNTFVNYNAASVLSSITPVAGGNLYVPQGDEPVGFGQLQNTPTANGGDNISGALTGVVTVGDGAGIVTLDYTVTPKSVLPQGALYTGTFTVAGSFIPFGPAEADLTTLVGDGSGAISLTWTEIANTSLMNASIPSLLVSIDASAVPDGGMTLALLGFAFVGVEGLRRKLGK